MDDALAQWLTLREPADAAARSTSLTRVVAGTIAAHAALYALDLGTGTGSNIRYLTEHLSGRQHWLAVDRSAGLLTQLPIEMSHWGARRGYKTASVGSGCVIHGKDLECHVEIRRVDLRTVDSAELFAHRDLVTASALLDLVSERWLRSLAARCRAEGASALFAITYDGRSVCSPIEPEDGLILDLFNRHQRTDKGLGGRAAGPDAVACAARCFVEAGYQVQTEPSDWKLGVGQAQLQRALIDGWAQAAAEIQPDAAAMITDWRIRRLRHIDAGRSRLVVGHEDVGACLPQVG
jgi:hypothetical protein